MKPHQTVVFADIVGSTALYETLGNERAAAAVTALTQWIGESIETHGGRVVKKLGDGVLGLFENVAASVGAMVAVMRTHQHAVQGRPDGLRQSIRVGLAMGDVVQVAGDCYGDAVNTAFRLCERAAPGEIWATGASVQAAGTVPGVSFVRLGLVDVKGKADPLMMYQVLWREDQEPDSLTMQAVLPSSLAALDTGAAQITLSWLGAVHSFSCDDMPVQIGRATQAQLCLTDPRVSRLHARIDWRSGAFMLTDLSSFGTWVNFEGSDNNVQLRRDSCLLHGSGRVALGVSLEEATAPTVGFRIAGAQGPR